MITTLFWTDTPVTEYGKARWHGNRGRMFAGLSWEIAQGRDAEAEPLLAEALQDGLGGFTIQGEFLDRYCRFA